MNYTEEKINSEIFHVVAVSIKQALYLANNSMMMGDGKSVGIIEYQHDHNSPWTFYDGTTGEKKYKHYQTI